MRIHPNPACCLALPTIAWMMACAAAAGQTPAAGQGSQSESDRVEQLIRQLGDPAYPVRKNATRELCKLGHSAAGALKKAAESDEFEVALRARNLLDVLHQINFSGCRVSLSLDRSSIRWDEPVELAVTVENRSEFPAQAPLAGPIDPASAGPDRRVGDMVDLGDFLIVTGPDGNQIELTVDDIMADPQVMEAIEWRAEGGDLTPIPPGGKLVYRLPEFNRGWARYRLLEKGGYSVRFAYAPDWDDPEFVEAGVGQVESQSVTLEVTSAAPEIIRQSHTPATLRLEPEGEHLVARLTCSDDLPIWVNLNLAGEHPPFANLAWQVIQAELELDVSPPIAADPTVEAFDRSRVVQLQPNESLELGRLELPAAWAKIKNRGLADEASLSVIAVYFNHGGVVWQRQQDPPLLDNPRVPEGLRSLLPRRMVTGRVASEPTPLPKQQP